MTRMTITDLLRYLHQRTLYFLETEESERLGSLFPTLIDLTEAASHYDDRDVFGVLDDLAYVIGETTMGSRGKGEGTLAAIPEKIEAIERRER
jgi:hypothetical protein